MNLSVSKISPLYITALTKTSPSFRADLKTDVFERRTPYGEKIKDVVFDTGNGGKTTGYISFNEKYSEYYAHANGTMQCKMEICDGERVFEPDCLYIKGLYGRNNKGDVKGAGTELVKIAVDESIKRGYGGRIKLEMAGSPVFYYKCNFRFNSGDKDTDIQNAAVDYMTRTGCEKDKIWCWGYQPMELTSENAGKFLKGIRTVNESKSRVLYSKKIKIDDAYKNTDMDFCDLGHKFVIQMINKDAQRFAQAATLKGKIENGNLITDGFVEYNNADFSYEIEAEFQKALDAAQKHYLKK